MTLNRIPLVLAGFALAVLAFAPVRTAATEVGVPAASPTRYAESLAPGLPPVSSPVYAGVIECSSAVSSGAGMYCPTAGVRLHIYLCIAGVTGGGAAVKWAKNIYKLLKKGKGVKFKHVKAAAWATVAGGLTQCARAVDSYAEYLNCVERETRGAITEDASAIHSLYMSALDAIDQLDAFQRELENLNEGDLI